MADDLERFLRQAAERLAEQRRQPNAGQRSKTERVRELERVSRTSSEEMEEEEIIPATVILDASDPRAGPDPLSSLDTRHLHSQVEDADERMAAHVLHVTGGEPPPPPPIPVPGVPESTPQSDQVSDSSEVEHRGKQVSPLIEMFRNPQSLKAAFIAGEIFRRKF